VDLGAYDTFAPHISRNRPRASSKIQNTSEVDAQQQVLPASEARAPGLYVTFWLPSPVGVSLHVPRDSAGGIGMIGPRSCQ
jgi:hypothetical protein